MAERPTAIDLFSGAGGLTVGLNEAGFEVLWAIDSEDHCRATYSENHPGVEFDPRDIRKVDPPKLDTGDDGLDLIAGGPPCPTFSVVGRTKLNSLEESDDSIDDPGELLEDSAEESKVLTDDRHYLYEEFIRYVEHFEPKALLMENVVGMRSTTTQAGENVVELIKRRLRDAGYRVDVRTLDAADYGVPQRRERLFFLGNRLGEDNPVMEEWATHREPVNDDERNMKPIRDSGDSTIGEFAMDVDRELGSFRIRKDTREPWVTVADAILDLPPVSPGGEMPPEKATSYEIPPASEYQQWVRDVPECKDWTDRELHNHECRWHNLHDLSIYKLLGEGVGWSTKDIDDAFHRYRSDVFEDQYTKQDARGPASTVTAHIEKDGHMSIHPREARSFTVREVARLQSFKDTYRFPVPRSKAYWQVGNAVPPLLAEALATAIQESVLN